MRIYEIEDTKFNNVWEKVSENCSEIIMIYKETQNFLYRGVKSNDDIIHAHSPINREPKDSSKYIQKEFDNLLSQCGMKAFRSNSIFTTSRFPHAKGYGNVYIVFPKNGFDFTYTNRSDLTLLSWQSLMSDSMAEKFFDNVDKYNRYEPNKPLIRSDSFDNYLSDIKKAYKDSAFLQKVTKDEVLNKKDFMSKYEPSNKNLDIAIELGKEVYIKGEYYAFDFKFLTEIKNRIFV